MSAGKLGQDDEARTRLRQTLGAGARYDSPAAPGRDLLWARRGTAYFARKLAALSDADLDAPSRVPGWSRRHVVAHVGYHARRLARLTEAARLQMPSETQPEPQDLIEDVAFAATLPAHALRNLFKHSEVHLNVEWRDLTEAAWSASIRALNGEVVRIDRIPLMRALLIWTSALDLNSGGTMLDFPDGVRELLDWDPT